ncbi:ATP-binding protein [Vibrio sp. S4M6]|uniref:ATP-binding protein n=1 Tax=Vibrio sinus TaxID=2946865 RepID=UPI00202A0DB5|nr:ATP-binding protein [Vibrio sinus]MCL9783366.1 ATP-binding protein [Vibrio sinus]
MELEGSLSKRLIKKTLFITFFVLLVFSVSIMFNVYLDFKVYTINNLSEVTKLIRDKEELRIVAAKNNLEKMANHWAVLLSKHSKVILNEFYDENSKTKIYIIPEVGLTHNVYYHNAFIYNNYDNKLYLFSDPSETRDESISRKNNIIKQYNSMDNGFSWGGTSIDSNGNDLVSMYIKKKNGIMVGISILVKGNDNYNIQAKDKVKYELLYLYKDDEVIGVDDPDKKLNANELSLIKTKGEIKSKDELYSEKSYLVAKRKIRGSPIDIIILYPTSKIIEPVIKPVVHMLLLLVFLIVFLLIYIYFQIKRDLSDPLNAFSKHMDLSSGNMFKTRLPVERDDELGRFAKHFNSLLNELDKFSFKLEEKVNKRTQQLYEAKKQAEKANERKNEHIANISHEIRTPLNGVMISLELLKKTNSDSNNDYLFSTASESSSVLLDIVNNLLDLSRIESGTISISSDRFNILDVIDQAMNTISHIAEQKEIQLECLVTKPVPVIVLGDETRVRQVLINLLGNAVKYTTSGSISILVTYEDSKLVFSVKDTGIGISKSDQKRVFNNYEKVDEYSVGTGIGLSLTKKLVELMGGDISLKSKLGVGSTFTAVIPASSIQENNIELVQKDKVVAPNALREQLAEWRVEFSLSEDSDIDINNKYQPGKLYRNIVSTLYHNSYSPLDYCESDIQPWSLKFLVVDDFETNRILLSSLLSQLGHRCDMASSGQQALEMGKQFIYDAVFLDLRMPDMNGWETYASWLKDTSQILDPDCMIIAVSADADKRQLDEVTKVGMSDYLVKPVSLNHLSKVVEKIITYQIERGIDLPPRSKVQRSVLNKDRIKLELDSIVEHLVRASKANDVYELDKANHSLKGVAGSAGIKEIHRISIEIEHGLHSGGSVSDLVEQVVKMNSERK